MEGRLETKAEAVEFLAEIAALLADDYDVSGPSELDLSINVTNQDGQSAAVRAMLEGQDSYYGIVIAIELKLSGAQEPAPYTFGFWASTNNARLITERIRRELGPVAAPIST